MKKNILLLSLLFVVAISLKGQGYAVGDIASDFSLLNTDGKKVSLADYKDAKGYIVIFTCNHCPYSIAYEDRIIAMDKKYKKMGYPVVAVNPNDPSVSPGDSYENMQVRAKEKGFTFPYLFDDGQHVLAKYGATRTPHVYLLEKTPKGNRVAYIGAIDDNYENADAAKIKYVENAIAALMDGMQPQPDFTKAIGCTVKIAKK